LLKMFTLNIWYTGGECAQSKHDSEEEAVDTFAALLVNERVWIARASIWTRNRTVLLYKF
jgi:hypothetical protein